MVASGEQDGTMVRFPSSLGLFEIVTVLVCYYFNQQVNEQRNWEPELEGDVG